MPRSNQRGNKLDGTKFGGENKTGREARQGWGRFELRPGGCEQAS